VFFIRAHRREQAAAVPAGLATIRSDAPGATAAACGSDSRGVPLQLGFSKRIHQSIVTDEEP